MALVQSSDYWYVSTGASWQRKIARGGGKRLDIQMVNYGPPVGYFIQGIRLRGWKWNNVITNILTPPLFAPGDGAGGATTVPNLGTFGGNFTASAPMIANVIGDPNNSPTMTNMGPLSHYLTMSRGTVVAGANAPWSVLIAVYATAFALPAPIYQEYNASLSNKIEISITGGGRVMATGPGWSWSNAAGPTFAVNDSTVVEFQYLVNQAAYRLYRATGGTAVSTTTAITGAWTSFADTTTVRAGNIAWGPGVMTGYTASPTIYGGTEPLNSFNVIAESLLYSSDVLQLESGTLGTGALLSTSYGEGTSKPFPPVVVYGFLNAGSDTRGVVSVRVSD